MLTLNDVGCMFLIGALYAADIVHNFGIARWVVIVSIFVFALGFTGTWAIVGKIYASEIQPAKTRAAASCLAQGLGFFTNWFVAFVTPILLAKSAYGAYFLFGGLALGTLGVLYIYMPETQGRPLESIQDAFLNMPSLKQRLSRTRRLLTGAASVGTSLGSGSEETVAAQEEIELQDIGGLLRPAIV